MMTPVVLFSIGNPGPLNRHSTGHMVLKELMENYDIKQPVNKNLYAIASNEDSSLIFVKSNTYMNESSKAWLKLRDNEKIPTGAIVIVLYDDFENDIPKVKLSKFGKKSESHNGIKNLQSVMMQDDGVRFKFFKLGIGIGPKPSGANKASMSSWVLSPFTLQQKQLIVDKSLDLCITHLKEIASLDGEIDNIDKYNSRVIKKNISE
ncbi:hypothetical protein KGF56_001367 [Candida oxycetoniae]|uniref:Peptidyl-tRNA hydrolase n=1 Tax=Candida oxycetoniae TaxID=497107 RepID=A0AAI9T0H6_9ASCO|nr:uncharacterized protein KGF56_001367 [Candida oxycetoniae]KAI3405760.2 hypothetical protein KGF56_001367 [Candida oxycetoniae]